MLEVYTISRSPQQCLCIFSLRTLNILHTQHTKMLVVARTLYYKKDPPLLWGDWSALDGGATSGQWESLLLLPM